METPEITQEQFDALCGLAKAAKDMVYERQLLSGELYDAVEKIEDVFPDLLD